MARCITEEERALDARELGVFLGAVIAITLSVLTTMQATASDLLARVQAHLDETATMLKRREAGGQPPPSTESPA